MDDTSRAIARFAANHRYEDMTASSIAATIRHHLDGIGCAAGAFASEPVTIARNLAATVTAADGCSVFGLAAPSVPEYAAFANGSAVRHLDYNDTYLAGKGGGGHPNDMAPAILAAVEMTGGSGKDLIQGIFIAYEVFGAICNAVRLRGKGIDQGASVGIGVAAATARIFGLDEDGIANAVALAIVPSTPVRVTRAGELSHWKGCATAHAGMAALFAARLSKLGINGPQAPFSGVDGFFNLSGPFELKDIGMPIDGLSVIENTSYKYFPSEFNSQGPITLLLQLRERLSLDAIESIKISSYHLTWHEIGGGQGDRAEKWDPKTRESADHSLPYLTAVALTDGGITLESFRPDRIADPALRPLMNKIKVVEDEAFSAHWKSHSEPRSRIEIRLKDGTVIDEEITNFRGHPKNSMDDADISRKFNSMIRYVLAEQEAKDLADQLWALKSAKDLKALGANFRSWKNLGAST